MGDSNDEPADPKSNIERLSGEIGQALRDYSNESGEPDFELEKFAINSVISATHTSEMDDNDRNDIIKKLESSGDGDDGGEAPSDEFDFSDDEDIEENILAELGTEPEELLLDKEKLEPKSNKHRAYQPKRRY